ncbi:MAG TPA: hypothetical protein VKB12_02700 [Pyrinomonadaceae bacterium]|nr:hypothetical protein [Pyrinomonadaceae bacterium]
MNSKKCVKCGLVNFPTESVCERCKSPLSEGAAGVGAGWTHTYGGGAGQSAPSVGMSGAQAAATSNGLYYKSSGEVTLAGLGAGIFGGLLVGLVLAFVYSYLISYIPFVYVNFLCTVGYVCGLGYVTGWLLRSGKMRNPAVGVLAAAVVSLVCYYVCWAVWLSALLGRGDYDVSAFTLASHPSALLDLILNVNTHGAWSIGRGKTPVTGILLWVVWAVEGLAVLVGPPAIVWSVLTSEPFCEFCGEWCEQDQGLVSLAQAEPAGLKQVFESKQFERLKSVGAKDSGAADWNRLDLHRCKRCDRTNTLTVKSEKITFDKKGNSKVESKAILSKLVLSQPEVEELRRVSRELTLPTPAPVREAEPSQQQQEPAPQV